MEEVLVPLNDSRKLNKANSFGSGTDIALEDGHGGEQNTLDYRIHAVAEDGKKISLWHDVSLVHLDPESKQETPYLNFVCEISKFSRKKYEIATDEPGNPIKQDEKKGVLREFKKGDIYFNYGCFPQTWEDPTFIHPDADGCRGDNDPVDVVEIGAKIIAPGGIRPVKVLGILCMIDEGECDWKVVVIDAEDRYAPFLNDIEDVEKEMPGMLSAVREWYRTYKIPDGKPPNVFGLNEKFMDKKYASEVIEECHHFWELLVSGKKERELDDQSDDVKDLVRNLSKNSLFTLGGNLDEHVAMHKENFGEADDDAVFF
mmetsp:Transcript_2661/g.3554  ORF Transcript_2661/g.3554 Transcript_2661/m.3554 type:complete len:315 (-) Transcript_2661:268-1212(-)|eukprot:CAMPEP_0198136726 /NCGR_PEP_ID=MMETSP1443-20131203/344_1 /TAXON_ID=186043 /ORGANISM="Entomoneis sp., Strain CCMP2396" /LENGTH=314 /DNA_ID=CAMNT_0043797997 /DNA_START=160 /DNA_END=1104 /DNA_ORIENTATION=-